MRLISVRPKLPRVPFALGLAALLVVGMVGLLALNIAIQSQSMELRRDQTKAKALADEAAALQAEADRVGSAGSLALQAAGLGMRPNPYGVIITLPDGTITGKLQKVRGDEVPAQVPPPWSVTSLPVQLKVYPVPPTAQPSTGSPTSAQSSGALPPTGSSATETPPLAGEPPAQEPTPAVEPGQ